MEMAKPERHPWPYGPQWNYYPPPHVLSLSKIPLPNRPQINSEYSENYLGIRCPEPRRPYQVPGSSFGPYYHQENHPVGSYIQSTPLYPPKQYVHRPIPQENFNNSYKFSESIHSYPTYPNNFSSTKDQTSCYQNSWNNTSHYQRKPPELDVRRFLATWQEKDDDLVEVSPESEEQKACQVYDSASLPLDCTKRSSSEKSIKKNYENFSTGQSSNTAGCVVPPYCIKDDTTSLNRSVITSGELNNNIPQRSNLNYGTGNTQSYHNKNFYSNSNYWKSSSDKFMPCEHNFTYTQPLNHCDINVNPLRSNISYRKQKDNLLDTSERSQYNLSSSLESGDLFCDINSRNDEQPKQPIVHPLFSSDAPHHRGLNCEEQPYYGQDNNDFPENLVYTDLHTVKEPWELFPSIKCKDGLKVSENQKSSLCKLPSHTNYEQTSINTNNTSRSSVSYEGAFNILPNLNDTTLPVHTVCNPVQYNTTTSNIVPLNNSTSPAATESLPPVKVSPNVTKCIQSNSKIKPYQFSEEISSDDIDISIASSGDLVVEDEHSTLAPISVINFSRSRKEKVNKSPVEINKECNEVKTSDGYSAPLFTENTEKSSLIVEENKVCNNTNFDSMHCDIANSKLESSTKDLQMNNVSPKDCLVETEQSIKIAAMDLSVLKPQNLEEISLNHKEDTDYLNLSNNYFGQTDFVDNAGKVDVFSEKHSQALPLQEEKAPVVEDPSKYNESIISTNVSLNAGSNSESGCLSPSNDETDINSVSQNDISDIGLTLPQVEKNSLTMTSIENETMPADKNSKLKFEGVYQGGNNEHLTSPLSPLLPSVENKVDESSSFTDNGNNFITNDNLLLLAHCSQEYGCQFTNEVVCSKKLSNEKSKHSDCSEKLSRPARDSVIKCSLRWDKIFKVMPDEDKVERDMSLDLGPAKVELRMPTESCSTGQWKVVEADNKAQTSSIVQVKRLILKRKSQSEERIPKMVIKKTEGQEYRSYLKKEPNEAVLNCGKFKIYYDIPTKSKLQRSIQNDEFDEDEGQS